MQEALLEISKNYFHEDVIQSKLIGSQVAFIEHHQKRYILRLLSGQFEERKKKAQALQRVSHYGSKLYYSDPLFRVALLEFHEGDPVQSPSRPILSRLATKLRSLHSIKEAFEIPPSSDSIPEKLSILKATQTPVPSCLSQEIVQAKLLESYLSNLSVPRTLCHADLQPKNILVTEAEVALIHWEKSGASDPYRDLATVGVFMHLSEEDTLFFLEEYLTHPPTKAELAHYVAFKAIHLMVGALWALETSFLSHRVAPILDQEGLDAKVVSYFYERPLNEPFSDFQTPLDFQLLALSCLKQFDLEFLEWKRLISP